MAQKDFSTISPSAKSLLLMKAYTDIPFAKETAALMTRDEVFDLSFDEKDFWFWMRVLHFELRYWSIDQLLKETACYNILELSSGYSCRGLDLCKKYENIHYLDTDLPDLIATKQAMISQLQLEKDLKGTFELHPLNALDETDFLKTVTRFDEQPIAIINEGLLMYLNAEQKQQLCRTVRRILKQRGGYWITADIYVKRSETMRAALPQSQSETAFFEQHQIEENKFESYNAAEAFFAEQGFQLVKEAVPDFQNLSTFPHLMEVLPQQVRNSKEPPPKVQATWMLKAV